MIDPVPRVCPLSFLKCKFNELDECILILLILKFFRHHKLKLYVLLLHPLYRQPPAEQPKKEKNNYKSKLWSRLSQKDTKNVESGESSPVARYL